MAQSTFTSVVLAKRPTGQIVPGETFLVKEKPILTEKDLKEEEVLVEVLYLSLDPAMRGWLNGMLLISPIEYLYASWIPRHILRSPHPPNTS